MQTPASSLLLIDGNGLMHRAFHALPPLTNFEGEAIGAVYGFLSALISAMSQYQPTHLLICFDFPAPTFRDEIFAEYRSQRPPTDENLKTQFPKMKNFLEASKIHFIEESGFEADDLMASACRKFKDMDKIYILSSDKDMMQIVDEKIVMISPALNAHITSVITDSKSVFDRLGVTPTQVADLKAICGDPSDNYKGIVGIGPKTAAKLLADWGSLEEIYKNIENVSSPKVKSLLINQKQDALNGKKLSKLVMDLDIPFEIDQLNTKSFYQGLVPILDEFGFKSLSKRVERLLIDKTKNITQTSKKISSDQPSLF